MVAFVQVPVSCLHSAVRASRCSLSPASVLACLRGHSSVFMLADADSADAMLRGWVGVTLTGEATATLPASAAPSVPGPNEVATERPRLPSIDTPTCTIDIQCIT